jgi:phage-related minor tail protein
MPVPWAQIVRLMPSILELSHELFRRTRRAAPDEAPGPVPDGSDSAIVMLEERISRLEELERKQAELVNSMAEQLEQLTSAATALHRQCRMLTAGLVVTGAVALAALIIAVRLSL